MHPLHSEVLNEIVKSLVTANKTISHALMDDSNPHFNSDFASLESVIDATKKTYLENDIVVLQLPTVLDDGRPVLVTTMTHVSGQWFKSYTPILSKDMNDPQKLGSGITYARRYALAAMANIGQTDDDGAGASGNPDDEKKPGGLIADDKRSLAISNLVTKFRKLGVSEAMICKKYGISVAADLEDEMMSDLNSIGSAIVNKKEKVDKYFKSVSQGGRK